jgi:hypothetical protein
MKDLKPLTRPDHQSPVRAVAIKIKDYQVTVKVKTAVPQIPSTRFARYSFR